MQTSLIEYNDEQVELEGFLAYEDNGSKPKPLVLVVHDWSGRNEFADNKAKKLAELGYVGFAIDMFGKGVLGTTNEEKSVLIQPFFQDRKLLRKRIQAALNAAKDLPQMDQTKIGAIGFCFGGMCVLELARSGAKITGVVSFHGLLERDPKVPNQPIQAKILALHGHDDPMVPPTHVAAFQAEMTQAKTNWQIHIYGGTTHAFTNPKANDPNFGTVYNAVAEARSWQAMKDFFAEIFPQNIPVVSRSSPERSPQNFPLPPR